MYLNWFYCNFLIISLKPKSVVSHEINTCKKHKGKCFVMLWAAILTGSDTDTSALPLNLWNKVFAIEVAEPLQSKHIYCNVTLVSKKKEKKAQSMNIDREQCKSCPQVPLSCSLWPCQVIQASEVSKFPGIVRETSLQLHGEKEIKRSVAKLINTSKGS